MNEIQSKFSGYQPLNRLLRYTLIASPSSTSSEEQKTLALLLLQEELLSGYCTGFYKQRKNDTLFTNLNHKELSAWEENVDQVMSMEAVELESKLLNAKNSTVRESIRLAHNEMGDLCYRWGKLEDAMKNYLKARDFCTSPQQQIDSMMRIVSLYFDQKQYSQARSVVAKINDLSTNAVMRSKAAAMEGVLLMMGGNFEAAAERFLSISTPLDQDSMGFLLPSDIGCFGSLCVLATSSRGKLAQLFSGQNVFNKNYLIHQPALRGLLNEVSQGNYSSCFNEIAAMEKGMGMDIFLKDIAQNVVRAIQEQLMLQFLLPYAVISLDQVATSFSIDVSAVEHTVAALIMKKSLLAKIDLDQGVIVKVTKDTTAKVLEETLALTSSHVAMIQRNLIHLSLLRQSKFESSNQFSRVTTGTSATTELFPSRDGPSDINSEEELETTNIDMY